jgi:hypothetical protein
MPHCPIPGLSLFDVIDPVSVEGLEAAAAYVEKLQLDAREVTIAA